MKSYQLKPSPNLISKKDLPDSFGKELNPNQKKVVLFKEGPLLVIAGAGSGKTKTLVHRVAKLIYDGIAPESILLLTFTRKSAQEMLKRAVSLLDNRCQKISGGTFHAFATVILRKYAHHIGYNPQFSIIDRSDSEDLIQVIRKECGVDKKEKRFPKKNTLLSIISKAINTGKSIEFITTQDYSQYTDLSRQITQIALKYQEHKFEMNVMDYDDLLVKLFELLYSHNDIRTQVQKKFSYILVDEYQDTNILQADIIKCLVNAKQNIMVVGDDAQSIYSFRGAHYQNIMNFPTIFPNTTLIKLEENYRSKQPILSLTNAVISHAQNTYTKTLFTSQKGGEKPVYIETKNEHTQSRFITQKILELREEGVPLKDIAILMRSGWHSNELEIELKASNIPFIKYGGFKFIEASHIKDVMAYIKLVYNPSDTIAWSRVLLLLEGLGPKGSNDILAHIKKHLDCPQNFPINIYKDRKYFLDLNALLMLIFNPKYPHQKPTLLLKDVMTYYKPLFQLTYENYSKRQSDLDSIEAIAEQYDDLETMLTQLTLDPPTDSQIDSLEEVNDDEKLILSTIHSAKGLEWHTVFLISAVDGYIPSFQSLGDLDQIEEERRLMYVALTRAKENLFILKPNLDLSQSNYYRYSGMQFSRLSRFLEEHHIIKEFAEQWAIEEELGEFQFLDIPNDSESDNPIDLNRRKYYF